MTAGCYKRKAEGDRYYEKVTALAMAAVVAASALTGCGSSSTAETTAAAAETTTAAADSTEAAKEDGKTYNVESAS